MWPIAGVLLGLVVLAGVAGFHVGPHSHAVGGIIGLVAAAWLVVMALTGAAAPLLFVLLSADLVVSAGLGTAAWKGLQTAKLTPSGPTSESLTGAEGVAVTALEPDGIVRVRGETWSATSMNGAVAPGTTVQILRASGVRLEVWGERETDGVGTGRPEDLFVIEPHDALLAQAGGLEQPGGADETGDNRKAESL